MSRQATALVHLETFSSLVAALQRGTTGGGDAAVRTTWCTESCTRYGRAILFRTIADAWGRPCLLVLCVFPPYHGAHPGHGHESGCVQWVSGGALEFMLSDEQKPCPLGAQQCVCNFAPPSMPPPPPSPPPAPPALPAPPAPPPSPPPYVEGEWTNVGDAYAMEASDASVGLGSDVSIGQRRCVRRVGK